MMMVRNVLWWAAAAGLGIVMEWAVAGVDFLLPSLMVTLKEADRLQRTIVFAAYVVIQEGLGSLAFGGVFIWYLTIWLAFLATMRVMGLRLWISELIVTVVAGVSHFVIVSLMCDLQDFDFDVMTLAKDCAVQMLVLPPLWRLAGMTRRGFADARQNQY